MISKEICYKCYKKKSIMMECSCGKIFCMKHYTPTKHNCQKSTENDKIIKETDLIPTGAFKKVDKI